MEAIADGTLRAGRHVQRQPAHDGGGPGHAHRGADARRPTTRFEVLGRRMLDGAIDALAAAPASPSTGTASGPRAASCSPRSPVRDYREFLAVDGSFSHAHWLVQHNGGVFLPPWGKSEQWTLSVQHEPRRRRSLRGQRRAHDERAVPPRLLDAGPDPPRLLLVLRRRPPLRFGWLLLAPLGNASGVAAVRRPSRTHREVAGRSVAGSRQRLRRGGTLRRWGRLKADSAMPSSSAAAART